MPRPISTTKYVKQEFPGAFRKAIMWLHHPHAWWGWIIAAPVWPFNAHIVLYYQLKEMRERRQ